ncbi:MAG: class I SAM-dependent methyltransferase [Candidatus Omnitrophota bacterium]
MNIFKTWIQKIGKAYYRQMLKKEYEAQQFEPNERSIEYRFVFDAIAKVCPKTVLDVGVGKSSLPQLMSVCGLKVTAIDNIYEYWSKYGMFNKHFYVINDDIANTKLANKFDLITCISTLEHIRDFNSAMKNMANLLEPKGFLVLTCPYTENRYIDNVYKLPESTAGSNRTYITQSFSRNNVLGWVKNCGLKIIDQEYWQCFSGDFWSAGERIFPVKKVLKDEKHHLACLLLQKE